MPKYYWQDKHVGRIDWSDIGQVKPEPLAWLIARGFFVDGQPVPWKVKSQLNKRFRGFAFTEPSVYEFRIVVRRD